MISINKYHILPFNFIRIKNKEVLVNELGDMIVVPTGTACRLVNQEIIEEELFKSLYANFFVTNNYFSPLMNVYATRLREKKGFLDNFTSLHIFVLTLRCNQNCVYCQASSQDEVSKHCSMSFHTMGKAVELMFKSRSPFLTMEFQGGEPTLEPKLIRYGIERAEETNKTEKRKIDYVLCTNSINLTEEIMDICQTYHVLISTSLDGPEWLHNRNRGKNDSYEKVVAGITKARELLGYDQVSALMTASEEGVFHPIEIVDEYYRLGFNSIFLRALNPYGLARDNSDCQTMMGEISEKVSIEAVLKAIGVQFVEICSPFDLAKAQEAVKRAAEHKGVAAVIFRAPCITVSKPLPLLTVNSHKCTGCKRCIKELGCPAISYSGHKAVIEPSMCYGCTICALAFGMGYQFLGFF